MLFESWTIQSSAIDIHELSFGYMKIERGLLGEATHAALAEAILLAGANLLRDQGQGLGPDLTGALTRPVPVHGLFQPPGLLRGHLLTRDQKGTAADGV